jgi:hypothetical protein
MTFSEDLTTAEPKEKKIPALNVVRTNTSVLELREHSNIFYITISKVLEKYRSLGYACSVYGKGSMTVNMKITVFLDMTRVILLSRIRSLRD